MAGRAMAGNPAFRDPCARFSPSASGPRRQGREQGAHGHCRDLLSIRFNLRVLGGRAVIRKSLRPIMGDEWPMPPSSRLPQKVTTRNPTPCLVYETARITKILVEKNPSHPVCRPDYDKIARS
jgi:hypothetical protein